MATNSQVLQSSSELTSSDLQEVLDAVYSISPDNVINFGLKLGVTRDQISAFETQYNRNMKHCLREILNKRLKQLPLLTWREVVQALESRAIGEGALASSIEFQYISLSSPVRGPSDRGHHRSQSPVRGPSDRGHYRSQSPVRGPSDRGHYRSQSPVRGPSDRGHYRSQSPVRGPSDRGHHRSQSPVRGPSDRGHYRYRSPVRGPSDRGHHRSQSPVRGPSDRGHYRSQSPVRGPSDRGHYRSQSPVRGPSDRGHYRYRSPVRGPSDRGHYRSQSPAEQSQPQYPPPPPPTKKFQYSSPQMSQFIDYVKTIYRSSEVERDTKVVKWPPTPSKVFINLACIDRASVRRGDYDEITEAMVHDGNVDVILESKRPILLNEVARDVSAINKKVVLVEGAPGVGKSTFAWEFCRRWERGEIAQQYQLVLLLRLRDERMSRAKSLRDLIYCPSESVSEAVSLELLNTHGFHALLILEGYDELPERCRLDQSLFPQLIAGKVLPLATIMVTSCPWATGSISHGNRIYQHIEILGFTSQQITQYIESTLPPDQVSDLSLYLDRHPQIRMCMYIPLNSAIVVTVYQESQAGTVCALPTTRTELYTALACTLLLRYLRGHPEYESGTKPMKTFNDLPPVVCGRFSELCKLAYSGIAGNSDHVQLIFNDLPSDFDSLGFMDSVTELYVTQGAVSSHNFLHLTFQEFLAAVHISTMSPSDQLEHFQRHEDGRYTVVLRFLAGLTKLTCFSKDTIKNIFTDTGRTGSPYSVGCDVDVTSNLVNWMFEAHSDDVISTLLERKTVCITFDEYSILPLDYYSLGHCIAHSQCQWVLSLNGEVDEEEVSMLMAGASTTQETSSRVGLRGGWDDDFDRYMPLSMSPEGLNMLFTQWKSSLHLHELHLKLPVPCDGITWPDLSGLQVLTLRISGKENWRLDSLLPHLSLESLTITADEGYLLLEDCDAIGLHIKYTTCLQELCVTCYKKPTYIGDEEMEVISKTLSDNQPLPLERLKLECESTFTDTAADCLAQFITNTTTLQHLTIHHCTFSAHGLLALAEALHHNSTLQEKSLEELKFTVNGDNEAMDYAQLLVEYPYMVGKLNRDSQEGCIHNISDVGAVALAQALHQNSTLKDLDLSGNDAIGKEGTHQLVQALTVNTSIHGLRLPSRCKEYATQCIQYYTVKDRIHGLELELFGNGVTTELSKYTA